MGESTAGVVARMTSSTGPWHSVFPSLLTTPSPASNWWMFPSQSMSEVQEVTEKTGLIHHLTFGLVTVCVWVSTEMKQSSVQWRANQSLAHTHTLLPWESYSQEHAVTSFCQGPHTQVYTSTQPTDGWNTTHQHSIYACVHQHIERLCGLSFFVSIHHLHL